MANQYKLEKPEDKKALTKDAMASFIKEMQAAGHSTVRFGGTIMPRESWAVWLALAINDVGMLGNIDGLAIILASPLGNSSQLGLWLLENGHLKREDAASSAKSLSQILAERAAAAQGGAS